MSEEKKELNDELLGKVVGGSSGNIPKEGITVSTYDKPEIGYYYSAYPKSISGRFYEVAHLFEIFPEGYPDDDEKGLPIYHFDRVSVEVNNDFWATSMVEADKIHTGTFFHSQYPYRLNIKSDHHD